MLRVVIKENKTNEIFDYWSLSYVSKIDENPSKKDTKFVHYISNIADMYCIVHIINYLKIST